MKLKNKNPEMKKMIEDFKKKSAGKGMFNALAEKLNRPRRKCYEMNLDRLEKFANAKETIVVPGVVLGKGNLTKPLNVAAIKFSGSARQKIEKAGGKCMELSDIDEKNVSKVRIMG